MAGKTKKPNAQLIRELRLEIDRLNHELGRYRKKVADDAGEVQRLRTQVEGFDGALQELADDRFAFVVSAALHWGWPGEDGSWQFSVPRYDIQRLKRDFVCAGSVDPVKDHYVFRVTEREAGDEV